MNADEVIRITGVVSPAHIEQMEKARAMYAGVVSPAHIEQMAKTRTMFEVAATPSHLQTALAAVGADRSCLAGLQPTCKTAQMAQTELHTALAAVGADRSHLAGLQPSCKTAQMAQTELHTALAAVDVCGLGKIGLAAFETAKMFQAMPTNPPEPVPQAPTNKELLTDRIDRIEQKLDRLTALVLKLLGENPS